MNSKSKQLEFIDLRPPKIWYNNVTDTSDFKNLPTHQKIELVFQLWDEIADSDAPIVLSSNVKTEIDRRCAELDADPTIAIDEDEMWRRVER